MGRLRKAITIVVLLAIIVAIVAWNILRGFAMPAAKKEYLEQLVEKVDKDTLDVIALPRQSWLESPPEEGYWKNPNTGQYTMCTMIKCYSCGEKIPMLNVDPSVIGDQNPQVILANDKCPKCGGVAIAPMGPWQGPR